jgi:hypothetical protein
MRFVDRGAWANNAILRSVEGGGFFTREQLKAMTIESLKNYVRRRIGGYTVAIKDMRTLNLYRGRICTERPETTDAVSYPPADKVKKLGRANRVGQSMFYCCVGAFPVFFEIHAKEGDLIALSEWAVAESLWIHNLGYHPDALDRIGAPVPALRAPLISPIPNESNRNNRLRRQMSVAFTKDVPDGQEYLYKETIAINELLFDRASPLPDRGPDGPKNGRVAGTAYPTIQMRGLADNLVMSPKFVDSSLRIKSVRYLLVESAREDTLSYTFLTIAYSEIFSDKKIAWQEALPCEAERRTHVAFESGQWIFRDGSGRIYDVH